MINEPFLLLTIYLLGNIFILFCYDLEGAGLNS